MAAAKRRLREGAYKTAMGKHQRVGGAMLAARGQKLTGQRRLSDAELKLEINRARASEKAMTDRAIAGVLREAARAQNAKVAKAAMREIERRSAWGLFDVTRFGEFDKDVHAFIDKLRGQRAR